ncbi:tripartite motif-containing protein 15 isoform X2 [Nycticebus coucang]|uniref:tripartite motif-containing protein 15 isoform X2 n=1 Tax=Nycticebus coucang TaxID=9470 RepID=UPI00234CF91D|nr:tripartite motif-containing protein 15 isoform X2 [Nycticebus coucang]
MLWALPKARSLWLPPAQFDRKRLLPISPHPLWTRDSQKPHLPVTSWCALLPTPGTEGARRSTQSAYLPPTGKFQGKEIRVDEGKGPSGQAGEGIVMPSTPTLQVVHEGANCPACTRRREDAVTTTCGHTCQLCLLPPSQMGAQPSGKILLCPLYQEEEQSEAPMAPVPLGSLEETYCKEHGEKIYFFCEKDAEFLCVFCRESPSHQAHPMGLLDEAIQPYRDRLRSRLEALIVERDEIENIKYQEDQKLQVLLAKIENKKQQIEAAFERLEQDLKEQRCLLLARLRELEKQIWKEKIEYMAKVSEEVAELGAQVTELEEKCQQPASELLQDVRVNQSRKLGASFGDRFRGHHSGPSDRQPEPSPLQRQEVGEVHRAGAEPARQSPALRRPPRGAGLSGLLFRAPPLAGGGAAGRPRRLHGGGGRGAGEEERRHGPERQGGRLGRDLLAPAVLGQHLPRHRPAAERHPARRGRCPGLRGWAGDSPGHPDPGSHLHFHRLFLRQSLPFLCRLEKRFLPDFEKLRWSGDPSVLRPSSSPRPQKGLGQLLVPE